VEPSWGPQPGGAAACEERELHIIKNRNGECGVVRFKFYTERSKFVEVDRRQP
jgi:replicative DNA helicase